MSVTPSAVFSVAIPNNTVFLGLPLALQGASLGTGALLVSNALAAVVGNL